jgi:hypothetical protein
MDTALYPEGLGAPVKFRHYNGILIMPGVPRHLRKRIAVADLITTAQAANELAPAIPGFGYRIIDSALIAIGGAVTSATSVDILATKAAAASRPLVAAVAALTQSALLRMGASNAVILADGASFTRHDANTPLNLVRVGSAITVATFVDCLLTYVVE